MEYIKTHVVVLILALLAAGCGSLPGGLPGAPAAGPNAPSTVSATALPVIEVTPTPRSAITAVPNATVIPDSAGRQVSLAAIPQRLISLGAPNTEILFALDLGKQVVGVDAFSDFPADAKNIAKVGGSDGKYNFEQIVALKPDLVLADSVTPADALKKLDSLKIPTAVIGTVNTPLEGVGANIILVGQMTGKSEKAKTIADALKQRIDAVKTKAAAAKSKPRVYWELDATDAAHPYSVGAGNFVNDFITFAGGTNIFSDANNPFPQVSAENVIAKNPEVIILSDAAYGISVDSLTKRKGWNVITAVKNKTVFPIDDNLVSRRGPRVADGLEAAAKLIHPELFK